MPERRLGAHHPFWFDTVVLSNFAIAEEIAWLGARYSGQGRITAEVFEEIGAGIAAGYSMLASVDELLHKDLFTLVQLEAAEMRQYRQYRNALGSGEASSIAAARSRGGTVVTDDRAARAVCSRERTKYTGTVGILIAACKDGQIALDTAEDVFQRMKAHGFYAPLMRLRDVIEP